MITYSTSLKSTSDNEWTVGAPFSFERPLMVSARAFAYPIRSLFSLNQNLPIEPEISDMPEGLRVTIKRTGSPQRVPEVCFGLYLRKTHFSAFIDREFVENVFRASPEELARGSATNRVCLLWDASKSRASSSSDIYLDFFKKLMEEHEKKNECVSFTVHTFSTHIKVIGSELDTNETIAMLNSVKYDGGTNLAVLGSVFEAQNQGSTNYDYFILCTDGLDNIGDGMRLPEGISPDIGVPIHVLVPGKVILDPY